MVIINAAELDGVDEEDIDPARFPRLESYGRLWFASGTEIVVLMSLDASDDAASPFFWTPVVPLRQAEPGTVVTNIDSGWSWYVERVQTYTHFFTGGFRGAQKAHTYFSNLGVSANKYDIATTPLAFARHGRPIALELTLTGEREGFTATPEVFSSSAFLLPTLAGVPSADVVNFILQERYGFEITTVAPEWSGGYVLPTHAPMLGELTTLRKTIVDAQARLPSVEKREAHAARFQALLYEGDDALEPVVLEALSLLGGDVEEPATRGVEDGRVIDPDGNLYMIEVKGLTGEIKRAHIRQLQDWVTAAQTDENLDCRGLLVANVHRSQPPGERAAAITGEVVSAARRVSHAVITTTQLFQALADLEAEMLTAQTFWEAVANAKGLVDLPELEPLSDLELTDASTHA